VLNPGDTCVTSSIEHPSISETTQNLEQAQQIRALRLPVRHDGVTDLSALDDWLPKAKIVSVMLANNETGVLQPIDAIVQRCRLYHIPVHTDAVQAVGKIPVSFQRLGVSAMTIAAHKFHGPVGIGALVLKNQLRISPLLYGGVQQSGLRPGTEPVSLAVGMWKALERWHCEAAVREQRMRGLRDRFESLITSALSRAEVIGKAAERVPHTANIAFPGIDRQALVMALDLRGIACSTGSACASGSSEPSPVLEAMQLSPSIVQASVRFSLGAFTTSDEIQTAAEQVIACVQQFPAAAGARH
jgi:cysteine desulfurase